MTLPLWTEASFDGLISGGNRLRISCGFCRDWQSYLVDIVDVPMSPVQFETRHPPHSFLFLKIQLLVPGPRFVGTSPGIMALSSSPF